MAGFSKNNFQDHRQFSSFQNNFGVTGGRNKLPEEGYWKDFYNQQVIA
jgi:hypothetical protein